MTKKTAPERLTLAQWLSVEVREYEGTVKELCQDYLTPPDFLMLLEMAFGKFILSVEELIEKPDFEDLFTRLKELPNYDIDFSELREFCTENGPAEDEPDEEEIEYKFYEWAEDHNTLYIKKLNMPQREKLERFIYEHIYPHYADQITHTNLNT